ncbi:hypothetical protein BTVI_06372 [Pitangus sulphuratus]|nr:hypothetical protein BTVI_06372 [Pitangus sulphuratus]
MEELDEYEELCPSQVELEAEGYTCEEKIMAGGYRRLLLRIHQAFSSSVEMVKGLEGKPCKEQLRTLGLFILEEIERRPHCSLQLHCSLVTSDRTQGSGMKLYQAKFKLAIRKRFFIQRMPGH